MSIRKCLSCLICIALLLNFVDAALPQFEIYLLDGRCPVPAGAVKLIIILLLLLGLTILRVRFEPEHDTFIYISLLAAYFAFEVIYLSQFYAASYVVFSFENYYAYLWLIPLFFMVRPSMPDKFWRVALPCMAIILTSIGFLQGYTNTPPWLPLLQSTVISSSALTLFSDRSGHSRCSAMLALSVISSASRRLLGCLPCYAKAASCGSACTYRCSGL
jgi:hypothetical protein